MKNLKVRSKLFLGFGVVLFMLLIAAVVSFYNMRIMKTQIDNYAIFTVPNNNEVWSMRRDMISIQRYLLIGLTSTDPQVIKSSVETSSSDATRLRETLESYLKTTRADKAKLDKIQNNFNTMAPYRQQIEELVLKGTVASKEQAYVVFETQYKPILDENAELMREIGDYQNERANQQEREASAAYIFAIILLVIVIVAAVLITIVITYFITRSILQPVEQVRDASRAISKGDLDTVISYQSRDELGALAQNMRDTTETLQAIIGDVDMVLGAMGGGDFTKLSACPDKYTGQFQGILTATQNINANLSGTLSEINIASDQVSTGADQVSSGAQALSQGATEQASSIEELSATITEISSKIRQNAQDALQAKEHSETASSEVSDSNNRMQEMITAMGAISQKSDEISKIIKTIEDIAFQTNILALNAAVEAARAGAAGKGFAVVADEVRNLASKSAEAAKSTTMLIEETVSAVQHGTRIADSTAKAMLDVVDVTREVTKIIVNIADASTEQSNSISQITVGVDQISSVIQTNSATAEESAASSEELSGQANMLKSLVARFKISGGNTFTEPAAKQLSSGRY